VVRKVYRTGFWLNQSLKSCSLTVYQGETFGLLGPNGAGKTTLLKLLLGIVRPPLGKGCCWALGAIARETTGGLPPENYFYDI